jgi:rhamnulokinase
MLEKLGIPTHFLGEIVPPCTTLGPLHSDLAEETGATGTVIAPATHDTGSAVAAVPGEGAGGWAYISCGTWSLVGVEERRPIITDQTLQYNLTNEGGVAGTFRLLRNVMGLWLLQQCRRAWERRGQTYTYDELARSAAEARPFATLIDPDDPLFLNPTDMTEAIAQYCARAGQAAPADVPATVRCIVESLALKYRWVIERLEAVTSRKIETVHIIGGGSRNRLLCQATADATGCRVLAGPVEATAIGNVVAQAMATGALGSLAEGRALVAHSFPLDEYLPGDRSAWDAAYHRLNALLL